METWGVLFFCCIIFRKKDQFVKSNTEKFRVYRNRKRRKLHAYFKTDEKNNTGAAGALSFDLPAEYAAAFSGWERAYSEPDATASI